jgi:lipid A ethanolaminephosphotransferase
LVRFGEDAKIIVSQTETLKPKLMVLVVGEAARAESFSLNGYTRNTTPQLAQIENLLNFSQVTSCGTATAVSVPCMFSGMTKEQYDANLAVHREGLLDIAQRAGYKVTWIDNDSGCKGACDRVNNIKISKKLKKQYCRDDGFCLDDVLLMSLQRYLASIPHQDRTPQLIVLHQRGSHGLLIITAPRLSFLHFSRLVKPVQFKLVIARCSSIVTIIPSFILTIF